MWRLLFKYLPFNCVDQEGYLKKKQSEYFADAERLLEKSGRSSYFDESLWHQIHIDILRTNTNCPHFQSSLVQQSLERILYVWAIRHPASGYVQGMNDIVLPLFDVFVTELSEREEHFSSVATSAEQVNLGTEKMSSQLMRAEADTYWCLCKLLANIQDNFTAGQSGIFRKIERFLQILTLIDPSLIKHFEQEGIEILSFSFRWFNCLLVREFPLHCIVRMWDSYLAEGDDCSFNLFHLFVCVAILVRWSEQLKRMNFQDCITWLQHLPTEQFVDDDIEVLLSEAFVLKSVYSATLI